MGPRLLPLACALFVVAGCGGGDDEEEVRRSVRDFVVAASQHDADAYCDLVTQEFAEQSTGAKGGKARDACKSQVRSFKGLNVELVRLGKVEVDGDSARATAVLDSQGQRRRQLFRLKKEDGDWRLAGGSGE